MGEETVANGDNNKSREQRDRAAAGEVIHFDSLATDLSRSPEELRSHLAAIIDSSDDAIVSKDLNGIVKSWNRGAEQLFGYSAAEMIGKPVLLLLPDDRKDEETMILSRIRRGDRVEHFETVRRRKDGSLVPVSITISPIRNESGQVIGASKIARSIEEQQRLQEVNGHLAAIIESSDDAIVSKDLNGVVRSWNKGAERLFGYLAEEMIGKSILRLLPEDRREEENLILSRIRAGEKVDHFKTVRVRKDGKQIPISVTISPVRNAKGKIIGASKVARDITEQRHLEERLEELVRDRTHQLEAANREMEGFTYSVSHDLRAPLRAIVSTAHILMEDFHGHLPEDAKLQLERQAVASKKLAQLVDDLLRLSRLARQPVARTTVDITAVSHSIAEDLERETQPCSVAFEIEDGLLANADPNLSRLLLLNLMENACKFSPNGGMCKVGRLTEGTRNVFFVQDVGVGFDMEFKDKIFLPFERLVLDSEFPGTGIGLANAKRIVERHQGSIWVDSEPGKGTTFYFTFEPG